MAVRTIEAAVAAIGTIAAVVGDVDTVINPTDLEAAEVETEVVVATASVSSNSLTLKPR